MATKISAVTTLEFTETQVKEILVDFVRKSFPHCYNAKPENVRFIVSAGFEDRMSSSSPSLTSAKIEVKVDAQQSEIYNR